jgi:predicted flap endonuclease-1-like 5' DNA nuclease
MWDVAMKMLLCLFLASLIGFVVGWLLKKTFSRDKTKAFEAKLAEKDAEIMRLNDLLYKATDETWLEHVAEETQVDTWQQRMEEFGNIEAEFNRCLEKSRLLDADLQCCLDNSTAFESENSDLLAKTESGASIEAEAADETSRLNIHEAEFEGESSYLSAFSQPVRRDVLREIKGVGPFMEKKLYELGVFTFREIALWDENKIKEVSAKLPRNQKQIQREGWIESAKEEHFKEYGERL